MQRTCWLLLFTLMFVGITQAVAIAEPQIIFDYGSDTYGFLTSDRRQSGGNYEVAFINASSPAVSWLSNDLNVTLADAIVALQIVAGLSPSNVNNIADVDSDGKIGLTEVIYILQKVAGIRQDTSPGGTFTLTSTAFADGATIPTRYTYNLAGQCAGDNVSPALAWTNPPANTKSFAIIMYDPDGNNWVHWVQFNLPAGITSLAEVADGPDVGVKGLNNFGGLGYGGPCPPSGIHHYIFTLYALDTAALSLTQGATRGQVDAAMYGHILGQATLTGLRSYGD